MGKLVVFSLLFFTQGVFAKTPQVQAECFEDKGSFQREYRDENGLVNCINFGGTKAVEYFYNDDEDYVADTLTYKKNSVVGKKFHGFKYIDEGLFVSPKQDLFHSGVLRELLAETRTNKTLIDVLFDYFSNAEQVGNFIDTQIKFYQTKHELVVPEDFSKLSVYEKLAYFQKHLQPTENPETGKAAPLSDDNQLKITHNIQTSINQKLSPTQCNPMSELLVQKILENNMYLQNDLTLPLLAHTVPTPEKSFVYLGNLLLDELFDKTIKETGVILKKYKYNADKKKNNERYCRTQNKSHENFGDVSVLTWVLVHEAGHVKQFVIMGKNMPFYKTDQLFLGLGSLMGSEAEFPTVPEDLRNKINTELMEPFMGTLEFSAEAFFADTLPCLL